MRNIRGKLTLTNSTVSNNSGGGVFNCFDYISVAYINNSTISGNQGIGVDNCYGAATLTNSTVSGNSRGGLFNDDSSAMTLSHTLVSGNGGSEVYNAGGPGNSFSADDFNLFGHDGRTNSQAFNYVFTPGPTDITATSDGTDPTPLNKILNPTLTFSGGTALTHNLVIGSPAVDAVTTGCPPPATDQRSVPRPQGVACDIGAVELVSCNGQAATLVGTAGNDVLKGTSRRDVIHGLGGNDRIFGFGGSDVLCGGSGNDILKGGGGFDECDGGSGTDKAASCETKANIP